MPALRKTTTTGSTAWLTLGVPSTLPGPMLGTARKAPAAPKLSTNGQLQHWEHPHHSIGRKICDLLPPHNVFWAPEERLDALAMTRDS